MWKTAYKTFYVIWPSYSSQHQSEALPESPQTPKMENLQQTLVVFRRSLLFSLVRCFRGPGHASASEELLLLLLYFFIIYSKENHARFFASKYVFTIAPVKIVKYPGISRAIYNLKLKLAIGHDSFFSILFW